MERVDLGVETETETKEGTWQSGWIVGAVVASGQVDAVGAVDAVGDGTAKQCTEPTPNFNVPRLDCDPL